MIDLKTTSNIIEIDDSNAAGINQLLELVSLFVHDLEGPMAVMQTILRLLDKGRLDPDNKNHAELVSSAQIAMERARTIIADLMIISRSNQLGIPVTIEAVELCRQLRNSLELIKPSAREYNVDLEFRSAGREYIVAADPDLLLRIMDNLLFNALRHSPDGGKIAVQVTGRKSQVIVQIVDQGPGFEGFEPADLFDKYKQLNLRLQGKHRGVGLGLYFCHKAIEAMHGKIWAQNSPQGGAEFYFTLNIMR